MEVLRCFIFYFILLTCSSSNQYEVSGADLGGGPGGPGPPITPHFEAQIFVAARLCHATSANSSARPAPYTNPGSAPGIYTSINSGHHIKLTNATLQVCMNTMFSKARPNTKHRTEAHTSVKPREMVEVYT